MIDRIKPKFLSSDQDERLGAEGMMTEALNVSISNYDEGDEGVIKNMKSNVEIEPVSGEGVGDDCTVIGKVEDPSAGRVYFFVASDTASENGIYYINVGDASNESSVKYNRLITNSLFNFDRNSFVKADIIKGTFLSSATEQTIIYFTDDINPPRKINVDRVADDVYTTQATERFDRVVSVIKGSSNNAPTVTVGSDEDREINNINDNLFQFATQIIYNDGEESAVSPYSKIAFSRPTYLNALEEQGFGVLNTVDNYIDVNHNVEIFNIPDINKIRILCRASNNASWFVAEEYDPKEGVKAQVAGSQTQLAAPNSNTYRFYADTLGSLVSPSVFNKPYDNVPLKASGQSIVRNRLLYSDYVEGFENVDTTSFPLTPSYQDEMGGFTEFITESEQASLYATTASNTQITIDFSQASAFSSDTDDVPAGTKGVFSFEYKPEFTVSDGGIILSSGVIYTPPFQSVQNFQLQWDSFGFTDYEGRNDSARVITASATQSEDGNLGDFISSLANTFLSGVPPVTVEYTSNYVAYDNSTPVTSAFTYFQDGFFEVEISFDDVEIAGTVLTIKPYVSNITLKGGTLGSESEPGFATSSPQTFNQVSDEQSDFTYSANSNPLGGYQDGNNAVH